MCPAASSRWCPTPEQLMILEEMYRSGIRTPNATQIQQITKHLACYGRIEGKNVFYWFQNHKARDRQKLRKKFSRQLHHHHQQQQQQQPQLQLQPQSQPQQAVYQPYYYNINNHHHLLHNQYHHQYQYEYQCCAHDRMHSPLDSSSACYSYPSALYLPRQGTNGGEAQCKLLTKEYHSNINYNAWNMDNYNNIVNTEENHIRVSSYGGDWKMMKKAMVPPPLCPSLSLSLSSSSSSSSSFPCFSTTNNPRPPPLETLELFPISSSNFKDNPKP